MTGKNPYKKGSKLSKYKTEQLIKYFAEDIPASKTAKLLGIERKTVNRWYNYMREAIYWYIESEKKEIFNGEIEIDESYFGPSRIKGKKGRGAFKKIKVIGILKRNGKVYTQIIPDCKAKTLLKIIRGKVSKDSIINTDGWKGYDGLIDLGYQKHYRVNHGNDEFVKNRYHINGIESFWSFTKRRLAKFNGIKQERFILHLDLFYI